MDKIDAKKLYRELYSPPRRPVIVEVPELQFVMVDGAGAPESSDEFQQAIGALYGVAYTLKFLPKKRPELEWPAWTVMPLEGLWFPEVGAGDAMAAGGDDRHWPPAGADAWDWTVMILLPDFIVPEHVDQARAELRRKGKDSPALKLLRLERFTEGLCAQMLHVGPYDAETENIARLHTFAREQGYELRGRHHEIYLSDPNRTAPERLKTVLRQPLRPAA